MMLGAAPGPHPLLGDVTVDEIVLADEEVHDDEGISGISIDFDPTPGPPDGSRPTSLPSSRQRPGLAVGAIVGGHFWLLQRVGSGGMGEVWAAEDTTRGLTVAVKLLLQRALHVPEIVARFEREAILLGRLHSDHAPRLLDYIIDPVYGPVLVTELVKGESLALAMKTLLSVEQALDLGIEVASGLADLHDASVVHRDLKPSNVILRPMADGRTCAVMIDLGVGRLVHEPDDGLELADITHGDNVVGTLEYMAPEQIVSCGQVKPAADLYALGALLFRAVTGAPVFGPGLDPVDVVRAKLTVEAPALPTGREDALARGFVKVVARALERNPCARYPSAEELRRDLCDLRELATQSELAAAAE
jgi:serine/threonine-protein kinase